MDVAAEFGILLSVAESCTGGCFLMSKRSPGRTYEKCAFGGRTFLKEGPSPEPPSPRTSNI
jgi:hypothetical protein